MKKTNVADLCRVVIENFDKIASKLNIEYEEYDNRITMSCPVHEGDNDSACVIFKTGAKIVGNWECFTHGCQDQYGKSIVGFLRGVLTRIRDKEQTYGDVVRFVEQCLSCKIQAEKVNQDNYDFCKFVNYFTDTKVETIKSVSRARLVSQIKVPSQYYVKRGYSKEILSKYCVGFCNTKGKPFYLRTVVPVFTNEDSAIGFVARTINPECPKCGWHHYVNYNCPQSKIEKFFASKWINSKGFCKTEHLYNLWRARPYIEESKTAIIVEGVGDVWRLEEFGIRNSLSIFGCRLSETQVDLLDSVGVEKLIIALDNDDAGKLGKEKIASKYGRYFNLEFITTTQKDIGDSSQEELEKIFNGKHTSNQREATVGQEQYHEVPLWV